MRALFAPAHVFYGVVVCAVCQVLPAQYLTPQGLVPVSSFLPTSTAIIVGTSDFDFDGTPDLVLHDRATASIYVINSPLFSPVLTTLNYAAVSAPSPSIYDRVIVQDVNLDGRPDLLVVPYTTSPPLNFYVYLNGFSGWGPLTPLLAVPTVALGYAFTELNGDGFPDCVLIRWPQSGGSTAEIILGTSVGGWQSVQTIPIPEFTTEVVVGDFTGDGIRDLAWPTSNSIAPQGRIYFAVGSGTGTFYPPTPFDMNMPAAAPVARPILRAADVDGDGIDDLVACARWAYGFLHTVEVFRGGTSGLQSLGPNTVLYGANVTDITTADVDADGNSDIVITWYPSSQPPTYKLSILRGHSNTSFTPPVMEVLSVVSGPAAPMNGFLADYDLDGDLDYLGGFGISVFFGRNEARFGSGCPGTGSVVPTMDISDPSLGNPAAAFNILNGLPNAPAAFGISLGRTSASGCGILLNLGLLLIPTGSFGYVTTSATGAATLNVAIPPDPMLQGSVFYIQGAVLDMQGSASLGGTPLALTAGRKVIAWW